MSDKLEEMVADSINMAQAITSMAEKSLGQTEQQNQEFKDCLDKLEPALKEKVLEELSAQNLGDNLTITESTIAITNALSDDLAKDVQHCRAEVQEDKGQSR